MVAARDAWCTRPRVVYDEFKESDHPRKDNGQFGKGSGGSFTGSNSQRAAAKKRINELKPVSAADRDKYNNAGFWWPSGGVKETAVKNPLPVKPLSPSTAAWNKKYDRVISSGVGGNVEAVNLNAIDSEQPVVDKSVLEKKADDEYAAKPVVILRDDDGDHVVDGNHTAVLADLAGASSVNARVFDVRNGPPIKATPATLKLAPGAPPKLSGDVAYALKALGKPEGSIELDMLTRIQAAAKALEDGDFAAAQRHYDNAAGVLHGQPAGLKSIYMKALQKPASASDSALPRPVMMGVKDSSILDHPLAALAALLGILIAFRRGPSSGERNQEANYDLRQYRPKPKEW